MIYLKAVLLWIPMILVGVGNGVLRETTYASRMSELASHQVSCLLAIVLFWTVSFALLMIFPLKSYREAFQTGFVWLALTLAFEFGAGHFNEGYSWEHLFSFYNILAGRLWVLVLLALFMAPALSHWLSGKIRPRGLSESVQ